LCQTSGARVSSVKRKSKTTSKGCENIGKGALNKIPSTFKLQNSSETFIENLAQKLDLSCRVKNRIEAENIINWCLDGRKSYVYALNKTLQLLKGKAEETLAKAELASSSVLSNIQALCGLSKHTSHTETYFCDSEPDVTSHNNLQEAKPPSSDNNKVDCPKSEGANLASPINRSEISLQKQKEKPKTWFCTEACKLYDPSVLQKYKDFLTSLTTCTLQNVVLVMKILFNV